MSFIFNSIANLGIFIYMHDKHLTWFTCSFIPQILISYFDRDYICLMKKTIKVRANLLQSTGILCEPNGLIMSLQKTDTLKYKYDITIISIWFLPDCRYCRWGHPESWSWGWPHWRVLWCQAEGGFIFHLPVYYLLTMDFFIQQTPSSNHHLFPNSLLSRV